MIYGYMINEYRPMVDLSTTTLAESEAMIDYLDKHLLTEGSMYHIDSIITRIKKIEAEIKSGNYDEDEIKEELDDLYDDIKGMAEFYSGNDTKGPIGGIMMLISVIATFIGYVLLEMDKEVKGIIGILVGMLGVCVGATLSASANSYDKVYDILIKLESKAMMDKRKAKQNNDKDNEAACDKVIAYVEKFKATRRDEYRKAALKSAGIEESAVINESDKHEMDINNFKQAVDEVNRYLNAAYDKLRLYCDTSLFMLRKGMSMNSKNKDKVLNEMIDKSKEANKKYNSMEYINVGLADGLLKKYNKFATKYSPYGMKVREKFEEKLTKFNKDVIDYLNAFYEEVSNIVTGKKEPGNIKDIANTYYDTIRNNASVEAADRAYNLMGSWYNDHLDLFAFIQKEIAWASNFISSNKIKATLRYKIFSKFVK